MNGSTEWDIEYINRISGNYDNSGLLVRTKSGYEGRTYHKDDLINGKQPVYIDKDEKPLRLLCQPDSLTIIGYID